MLSERTQPARTQVLPVLLGSCVSTFYANGKPPKKDLFHKLHLLGSQFSEGAKEELRWDCLDALNEESTRGKKTSRNGNFELRSSRCGGVGNHSNKSSIAVRIGHADHQRRTNFLSDTKVHLPDLCPLRHAFF